MGIITSVELACGCGVARGLTGLTTGMVAKISNLCDFCGRISGSFLEHVAIIGKSNNNNETNLKMWLLEI